MRNFFASLGLTLALFAAPAAAQDKVVLQLKWVTQGQFAGYFVAKEKGFYEEANLDVEIKPGGPDIAPPQVIAGGGADVIIDWMPAALASREKGVALVNIAQPFKKSGMMLTCRKETGITKPEDFKGKTLGVWFFGNEYPFLSWMSQLGIPTLEVPLDYGRRPEGSKSKLNSVRDGMKILLTFVLLLKETRPVIFFGLLSAVLALTGLILALPIFATWLETGLVPRFPTAMLSTGLMLLAALSAACGLILDSLTRARIEQKRILYLAVPALRAQ